MWTCAHRSSLLAATLIAALSACADEPHATAPAPPLFSNGGTHSISGTILGSDGTNICNSLPAGALVLVRVIDPINATPATPFAGAQNLACPNHAYAISVTPGTYRIRVQIPTDPSIAALPFRHLTDEIVVVDDVSRDIEVSDGIPLGGLATFEGAPVAAVGISLGYTFPTAAIFAGVDGVSGADGGWDDASPRSMMAQAGMTYRVAGLGCPLLGARLLNVPPNGSFLFPDEVGAIDCTMETAPSVAFSHDLTSLVVTPMPGDIGGQSGELLGRFGRGWGVQFPVAPLASPVHAPDAATHLFRGGLLVGKAPDVVLAGFAYGDGDCGASCRDFGIDGIVSVKDMRSGGKHVTWRYSDAASLENIGLRAVQHSFDGRPPYSYVLFHFVFTNTSSSTQVFHAGFYGDWDLNDVNGATDDIGFTDLGGKLMYVTNNGEVGVYVGTMLLGDFPVTGTFFFGTGSHLTLVDQVNALSGAISQTSLGPTDIRYIHGVGPIKLKRHESADMWVAIVAGEDKAQLLANATAAQADVKSRGSDDQGENER